MLCHRLISPGQLGRRICTHSTLAVRTQATSGANFVITTSESSAPTSRGYPDRNRAVRKDKCREPTLRHSTGQHKNDHAQKEKQNSHDRFPLSPYLGLGSFLRIPPFLLDSLSFLFFQSPSFFFFPTFVRRKDGVQGADRWIWPVFWGGTLFDWTKSTNCNSNDYAYVQILLLSFFVDRIPKCEFVCF
jgi:hypothetical protein